jgi:hypothetical protein
MGGDRDKQLKMTTARDIYARVTDWWLHAAASGRRPRVKWAGHDIAVQAASYPTKPKGSWKYCAPRLPELTQRDGVITQWLHTCKSCYLDGWPEIFPEKDFTRYMMNVLRRRKQIRKRIKDLLEQALHTVAVEK